MAKVRHEILLNVNEWTYTDSTALNLGALVPFDPANYNYDTLTVYFDVDGGQTSTSYGYYYLEDDGVARATIGPISTTTRDRRRATASGITAGNYEATMSGIPDPTIYCAKMIIIQDTGTSEITDTVCYAPIGYYFQTTSETAVTNAAGLRWYYEADNWSTGDATFYVDVPHMCENDMYTTSIELWKSSTPDGTYSFDTQIFSGTSSETVKAVASASFTPTDGYWYRIYIHGSDSMGYYEMFPGCIRVEMSNATAIEKFETRRTIINFYSPNTGDSVKVHYEDDDEYDIVEQLFAYIECLGSSSPNYGAIQAVGSSTDITDSEVGSTDSAYTAVIGTNQIGSLSDNTEYNCNKSYTTP